MVDAWPEFDETSLAAAPAVTCNSASATEVTEVRGHEIFTGHNYTGEWDQRRKLPQGHGRCVFRSERGESGRA